MDNIINSLELYINGNVAAQTEKENFLFFIEKLKSSRRIRFVYRGDSNIFEQYKIETGDLPLLAYYIFWDL